MNEMRLLIADDDPDTLETLLLVAKILGIEARGAADGIEALEMLGSWEPDSAILDIQMPRLSGVEVARAAKERGIRTRLIAFSASKLPHDVTVDDWFDAFLRKPSGIEKIKEILGL